MKLLASNQIMLACTVENPCSPSDSCLEANGRSSMGSSVDVTWPLFPKGRGIENKIVGTLVVTDPLMCSVCVRKERNTWRCTIKHGIQEGCRSWNA
ncbi:mitochondrial import receptor subunit TOM7 homolog isoform X1 [Lynx canadensis]|uniref:mitochondrial import receptor subunit TOM7 homolog isoform X1 n=1 Tax=Lynx canadensis TaxID=61383 RepID=UPI0011B002B4|nr:mitochondrial import receptor subunit TOM7 homolog isoform X1 [Lynx canadensis]